MARVRVNTDVDVEPEEFSDDELIRELEYRGYIVSEEENFEKMLDEKDFQILSDLLKSQDIRIGSDLYFF